MKLWIAMVLVLFPLVAESSDVPEQLLTTIDQIKKADYEGDRGSLKKHFEELSVYVDNKEFGSHVRYWRGFALWRRAINGFNENPLPTDLEQDFTLAVDEFENGIAANPADVESKIGKLSCLGYLAYAFRENKERMQKFIAQASEFKNEITTEAKDNPRFIWILGPWLWNTPVEKGGGQAKAIESYENGLEIIRRQNRKSVHPLKPTWGEPELLMSLSWSYFGKADPDFEAAEKHATAALALVPYWHYVRDILIPQIQQAKQKAKSKT